MYGNNFICTSVAFVVTAVYIAGFIYLSGDPRSFLGSFMKKPIASTTTSNCRHRRLQIATWNIAAINYNPFEYWITYDENPTYEKLMVGIEQFFEDPGENDILVSQVFTNEMFQQLDRRLTETAGWNSVKEYWESDFSKRTIVQGFLKDKMLASKRLIGMLDRVTNTIHTAAGKTVFRPTVINMYEEDLSTLDTWWKKWKIFMFDTKFQIKVFQTGQVREVAPYAMLPRIVKRKYPQITDQEEADSLPLQTMCGAIYDAILVHIMNTVSEPETWQPLKKTMVEKLYRKKVSRTLEILESQYLDSVIITLQEVSSSFIDKARMTSKLGDQFYIIAPADLDAVRDQNSVICLKKQTFPNGNAYTDITEVGKSAVPSNWYFPLPSGALLAITVESVHGDKLVIASFHCDINGLATIPVTNAIVKAMKDNASLSRHKLIFGLDANTYEHATPGRQQDVLEYAESFQSHGLSSCWGDTGNPSNYTTYNARTYLQIQLDKACRQSEKHSNGDVNPKDFILFLKSHFQVIQTWKDNTGMRQYIEDMVFPTLDFPSDHGILATIIEPTTSH